MTKLVGIYCIENSINNKKYFGSSFNVKKRLHQHKTELINQTHHNILLQRAVNKHGIDSFNFYLVEELPTASKAQLFEAEQNFIDQNVAGYNLAPAGGGDIISTHPNRNEIIKRISDSLTRHNAELTPAQRKEKYGRKGDLNGNWREGGTSFQTCPVCNNKRISKTAKCCNKCRDRTGPNNTFYGKSHSDKTKAILREKSSGANSWIKGIDPAALPYSKKYTIKDPNGVETVVVGLKAIAVQFDVSIAAVHQVIKRIKANKFPKKGKFANFIITETSI